MKRSALTNAYTSLLGILLFFVLCLCFSPDLLSFFLCIASGRDASDKEKTKKKGKGEDEDSEEESKDDDEEEASDDDEEQKKDGTFYIQLVSAQNIRIPTSPLLPYLSPSV